MSLQDISDSFKIDLDKLYMELKLDKNIYPPETKAKDLKTLVPKNEGREFEVEEIREVVGKLIGIEAIEPENTSFELEGTMTIKDIVSIVGGTGKEAAKKLGLPESIPKDIPLKELKDDYNFSMPDLKKKAKEIWK